MPVARTPWFFEYGIKRTVCAAIFVFVVSAGCNHQRSETEILFFAAASSNEAVSEICQLYESQDDEIANVRSAFASSSTLATQILNGASADVFLSANLQWVEKLKENGMVESSNRIVGNQLVVITSSNQSGWRPSKLEDLLDDRVKRIALADPDSVPAGIYAKNAMTKCKIWQGVKPKLIYGTDVRQTLAHVDNAAVDLGIVYRTDANISSKSKVVFEIPIELTGRIDYGLVLTKHGQSNPNSRRFYDFLSSANSKRVFETHGFLVTEENE